MNRWLSLFVTGALVGLAAAAANTAEERPASYRETVDVEVIKERTVSALLLGFEDNRHGMELRITRQEHEEDQSLVHMLLEVPIRALSLIPGTGQHVASGMVYVVSRPDGGELSPLRKFPFSLEIPDHQLDEAMGGLWGIRMVLRLDSGSHRVAVALRDDTSGGGSTVRTTVDVRNWGDPFGP
jgi:hypothetical protein